MKPTRWAPALFLLLVSPFLLAAQPLVPAGEAGVVTHVPFPVDITLDGKMSDWAAVPSTKVVKGPSTSKNPAENGSFSFSLAAKGNTLFVLMTAVDTNLVTRKHGGDYWNEDSLEFYLNVGTSFGRTKYDATCIQYRVIPGDIGNTDPTALTPMGTNVGKLPLKAFVFRTADGWGFEGAIEMPSPKTPAHGVEVGFQAQMNGAAEKDRNVKLIWSNADTGDNSWQDPSVFGRGIFYEVGRTDIPQPSVAKAKSSAVALNQYGYTPASIKTATIARDKPEPLSWWLVEVGTFETFGSGMTTKGVLDPATGQTLHTADFTSVKRPGEYRLVIDGLQSTAFTIGKDLWAPLARDAQLYFTRNRSGMALTAELVGAAWARPAGHLSDASTPVFEDPTAPKVNGLGGWYDAGDYGKYVVNGGISVWTLQNAWERTPAAARKDRSLLDEARWEMEFLLNMQITSGPLAGLVYHKLHDRQWSGVPSALPTQYDGERYVYEPSTAAALNLAATAAQAARLWKGLDEVFSARALKAATGAWQAALAHPDRLAGNVPGSGGGNYDDATVADDFFWAASELFATTGDAAYLTYAKKSPYWSKWGGMSWGDTGGLGSLALLNAPKLSAADRKVVQALVLKTADQALAATQTGYRVPLLAADYVWGSNSVVLNNALVLALAYDATKAAKYRDAVIHAMDYLLGHNALNKSFITGYGADSTSHPHHRLWANDPDAGYPAPPPGAVAGGPNAKLQDPEMEKAELGKLPVPLRYLDVIGSYATNEVAINWNAPLVWVARWLTQGGY